MKLFSLLIIFLSFAACSTRPKAEVHENTAEKVTTSIPVSGAIVVTTSREVARSELPPSPLAVAAADSFKYYVFAGISLFVVAAFLFYRAHFLAGILFSIAAIILPTLAHFALEHTALTIAAVLASAGITAFILWHTHLKPRELLASVETETKKVVARVQ